MLFHKKLHQGQNRVGKNLLWHYQNRVIESCVLKGSFSSISVVKDTSVSELFARSVRSGHKNKLDTGERVNQKFKWVRRPQGTLALP